MKQIPGTDIWTTDGDDHFTRIKGGPLNYQQRILKSAIKRCDQRRVAVDIGAHIGLMTIRLAQHFEKVYAFEPAPDTFECLKRNTEGLENVVLFNCGIDHTRREAWLGLPKDNTGNRTLIPPREKIRGDKIRVMQLDELELDDVDFIKMDIQGYEYWALMGCKKTIKANHPVVMIEFEDPNTLRYTYKRDWRAARAMLTEYRMVQVDRVGTDTVWKFLEGVPVRPYHGLHRYSNLIKFVEELLPNSILEIGTYSGRHAAELLERVIRHVPDVQYMGIDLFRQPTQEEREREAWVKAPPPIAEVKKRLDDTGAKVALIQGDSRQVLPTLTAQYDEFEPFDLIIIDGGHNPETIQADWTNCQPLIGPQTVVVLDDYYECDSTMGCRKLIDSLGPEWNASELGRDDHEDYGSISMIAVRRA